jgi:hypothetical protein
MADLLEKQQGTHKLSECLLGSKQLYGGVLKL